MSAHPSRKTRGYTAVWRDPTTSPEAMKPEFIALILLGALYLFWTQRLRTDITALLVMLSLAFLGHDRTVNGQPS